MKMKMKEAGAVQGESVRKGNEEPTSCSRIERVPWVVRNPDGDTVGRASNQSDASSGVEPPDPVRVSNLELVIGL